MINKKIISLSIPCYLLIPDINSLIFAKEESKNINLNVNVQGAPINVEVKPVMTQENNQIVSRLLSWTLPEIPLPDKVQFKYIEKQTRTLFVKYKTRLILTGIIGWYILLYRRIIDSNHYLSRSQLWSSWKHELSLEYLTQMSHAELTEELLHEIQKRYTNPANPTDFMTPLIEFIAAIDQESQTLMQYQKRYQLLRRLRITHIMPIDTKKHEFITKRLERLSFVKNIFLSWAAEYKINHNKKNKKTNNKINKLHNHTSSYVQQLNDRMIMMLERTPYR